MTLLFDKRRLIVSPALAPAQRARATNSIVRQEAVDEVLTIGLINNMPDPALQATERQFMRLLTAAAGNHRIRFPLLLAALREPVAAGEMAGRPAIYRHRRSRPPAHRRLDRHRRRAECRNPSGGAVLAGPHRYRRLGQRPIPVRRSGRASLPTPRCCISMASSGSGSPPNVPGSTTALRSPTTG